MTKKNEPMIRWDGSGRKALLLKNDSVQDICITLLEQVDRPEGVIALAKFLADHQDKFERGIMLYAYNYPKGWRV